VGEGRFVGDDRYAYEAFLNNLDVSRKNNQEREKRTRGLREADLVCPDDILVNIRDFGAIMVVIGDLVVARSVRCEMGVGDRRAIGRMRLVHVFPPDHGRYGQPWHQRRDDQEPSN